MPLRHPGVVLDPDDLSRKGIAVASSTISRSSRRQEHPSRNFLDCIC